MAGTEYTTKRIILKTEQDGVKQYYIPYVPNATDETTGLVKPDGKTIKVDENGIISAEASASSGGNPNLFVEGFNINSWQNGDKYIYRIMGEGQCYDSTGTKFMKLEQYDYIQKNTDDFAEGNDNGSIAVDFSPLVSPLTNASDPRAISYTGSGVTVNSGDSILAPFDGVDTDLNSFFQIEGERLTTSILADGSSTIKYFGYDLGKQLTDGSEYEVKITYSLPEEQSGVAMYLYGLNSNSGSLYNLESVWASDMTDEINTLATMTFTVSSWYNYIQKIFFSANNSTVRIHEVQITPVFKAQSWNVYLIAKEDGTLDSLLHTASTLTELPEGFAYYRKIASLSMDADKVITSTGDIEDKVLTTDNAHKIATTGNYNDLWNKPNLAAVATSGSYNDLVDIPENPIATTEELGMVKVDGTSIVVAEDGTISTTLTQEAMEAYVDKCFKELKIQLEMVDPDTGAIVKTFVTFQLDGSKLKYPSYAETITKLPVTIAGTKYVLENTNGVFKVPDLFKIGEEIEVTIHLREIELESGMPITDFCASTGSISELQESNGDMQTTIISVTPDTDVTVPVGACSGTYIKVIPSRHSFDKLVVRYNTTETTWYAYTYDYESIFDGPVSETYYSMDAELVVGSIVYPSIDEPTEAYRIIEITSTVDNTKTCTCTTKYAGTETTGSNYVFTRDESQDISGPRFAWYDKAEDGKFYVPKVTDWYDPCVYPKYENANITFIGLVDYNRGSYYEVLTGTNTVIYSDAELTNALVTYQKTVHTEALTAFNYLVKDQDTFYMSYNNANEGVSGDLDDILG